jgi:hypothetical protein
MSDLVFIQTDTHVEWIQAEGTWAVCSGLDPSADAADAVLFAFNLGVLDKVLFAKGAGRGGRGEVGKVVGDVDYNGRHYWLIDFEFDGWEDFAQDGTIKPGGD